MGEPRCPRCHRTLVRITLEVSGRSMTMRSCSRCDTREWEAAEGPVALAGVLEDLTRGDR